MDWTKAILFRREIWLVSLLIFLWAGAAHGQEHEKWKSLTVEYKHWLDSIKLDGHQFWTALDSTHRPHRLYVGEGFHKADHRTKEDFVEIFSRYLAGHPEKFMLIDIFDSATGNLIGEFGWGGFKLYQPSFEARHRERLSR